MDTIKRFLEAFRASETNARRFPREGAGQRERSRISVSHVLKWVQRRRRWKRGRPTLRHHETHISGNWCGAVSALTAFWSFAIYAESWWSVTNALTHPGSATCGMSLTTYDITLHTLIWFNRIIFGPYFSLHKAQKIENRIYQILYMIFTIITCPLKCSIKTSDKNAKKN